MSHRLVAVVVLAAGGWSVAGHAGEPARIVARGQDGARVAQPELPPGRSFALAFRHSHLGGRHAWNDCDIRARI